ncbi:NAD-P-binding protein [Mollisia scopiformis]|uniref:NAD-P-binding protein n=1 Tax=Mollisia scopiformis TaxID=149040 RepID=A0A132B9P0_MOLSC|nr:NAD-P-binding protein [Mollisia scopiformis]KUJ08584.1 NAD-P-binding protein [Mollisia scopiformis]
MSPNHTVLVTGVNGFIGSHVADQFLAAGYDVRGTTRTIKRGQTIKKVLDEKHGAGRVEIVAVPDISIDGAFDEAVKGVHAVAHVALILTFDKDASKVIPPTVAATTSILESCLKEKSVASFVYTSSSAATCRAMANVKRRIDSNSWNEQDIKEAWKPESEWQEGQQWVVYGASKAEAEKALWKFRDEKKPHFTINAVLPDTNFGPVMLKEEVRSTANFLKMACDGMVLPLQGVAPQYWVDVRDTARLHVAAVKYPDVNGRRIFGWVKPYNWNQVLKVLRKIRPGHKFPDDIPDPGLDLTEIDVTEDEKLLARLKGTGWTPFNECLDASLKSYGY